MGSGVGLEIRMGCSNVSMFEGDVGSAACVLLREEMNAYDA